MGACASISRKRKRRWSSWASADSAPPTINEKTTKKSRQFSIGRQPKWSGATGADRIELENCGMMMSLGQTRIASVDYEFVDSQQHKDNGTKRQRLRKLKKPKSWLLVVVEFGPLEKLQRASLACESKHAAAGAAEFKMTQGAAEVHIIEDDDDTTQSENNNDVSVDTGNKIGIVIKFHELYDFQGFRVFPPKFRKPSPAHMRQLTETIDDWVGKYIVFSTVYIKNNRIWVMVIGSFGNNSFETYFFKGADVYTWTYKITNSF